MLLFILVKNQALIASLKISVREDNMYCRLNLVNNQVKLSAFTISPSVPASEHQLICGCCREWDRRQRRIYVQWILKHFHFHFLRHKSSVKTLVDLWVLPGVGEKAKKENLWKMFQIFNWNWSSSKHQLTCGDSQEWKGAKKEEN